MIITGRRSNMGLHLTAAPVALWAANRSGAQPQVNPAPLGGPVRITLDADVAPELIRRAWEIVKSGLLEDRMLTDLEALGFLVLTHNLTLQEIMGEPNDCNLHHPQIRRNV